MTSDNWKFTNLVNSPIEEIWDRLKSWRSPYTWQVALEHQTMAVLPESIQQAIKDRVERSVRDVQNLGCDQAAHHPRLSEECLQLRADAMKSLFDRVTDVVMPQLGSLPQGSSDEEFHAALTKMLDGGPWRDSLSKQLALAENDVKRAFHRDLAAAMGRELKASRSVVLQAETAISDVTAKCESLAAEKAALTEELEVARLGFAGRARVSFGAVSALGKTLKGGGVAAGFAAAVDGGRRALGAVEVDKQTGEINRNWTKTLFGAGEAAAGVGLAGVSAVIRR